ncbi:hypothetical protein DPMN_111088 [Dreissena polymorpha]|uniref:Uncharacterized protein n=1 Tax=Dreissena polymorpha TaxID=45954 RepID=A0A9D4KE69_DREPO|nr:hypothetical protein DPMN_111088 [Dreissena polymorpha]
MGAMPLFSSAQRDWDQDKAVAFQEAELKFKWPPCGWKGWSADLRKRYAEFHAMSILKAQGVH